MPVSKTSKTTRSVTTKPNATTRMASKTRVAAPMTGTKAAASMKAGSKKTASGMKASGAKSTGSMTMSAAKLSDQDLLNDMLVQQKQLSATYTTFITEADCPNLRKVLTSNLQDVLNDQYQTFDAMRSKGYYQTKMAPPADVKKAVTQFANVNTQMH